MYKQFIHLGLLLLLVTGCKLSAFNQISEQNTDSAPPLNIAGNKNVSMAKVNSNSFLPVQTSNQVCFDPAKPCQHKAKKFDDWELSFRMPAKLTPNKTYKSAAFYVVILKTYEMVEDCDDGEFIEAIEAERKELQANQLTRKVFAAYQCPNMGAVDYDFDGKLSADKESIVIGNFLAIYAAATRAEAEESLRFLKKEYPAAVVKQMTVSYGIIEQ